MMHDNPTVLLAITPALASSCSWTSGARCPASPALSDLRCATEAAEQWLGAVPLAAAFHEAMRIDGSVQVAVVRA